VEEVREEGEVREGEVVEVMVEVMVEGTGDLSKSTHSGERKSNEGHYSTSMHQFPVHIHRHGPHSLEMAKAQGKVMGKETAKAQGRETAKAQGKVMGKETAKAQGEEMGKAQGKVTGTTLPCA
jgi:hypothetical protein